MRDKGHRTLWLGLRKDGSSPEGGWKLEGVGLSLRGLGILSTLI